MDCGLLLFVACGFLLCFQKQNGRLSLTLTTLSSCRAPVYQAGGSWAPQGKILVRTLSTTIMYVVVSMVYVHDCMCMGCIPLVAKHDHMGTSDKISHNNYC